MIQIGYPQAHPAVFPEGQPADLDKILGRSVGEADRPAGSLPAVDAEQRILFVSPPPLPWPRVSPGL